MTEMKIIARIRTELPEKFGVPRQSGLVPQLRGRVVFEPGVPERTPFGGLEDFSHIWLIWQFSQAVRRLVPPRCGPPGWGETAAWGCLPPAPPSGPTPWGCPPCSWTGWSWTRALGPVLHVRGRT